MRFSCLPISDANPPVLRPAPGRRDWMDASPDGWAYRCLPLVIANQYGWEWLNPVGITAVWNGGPAPGDVAVVLDEPGHPLAPEGHFGSGTVTFQIEAIYRTPPGWDTLITGPFNGAKDGIAPLSGIIETSWLPFGFTMNWRFTRPHHEVRFEKGEPIAVLVPQPHAFLEEVEPEIRPMDAETRKLHDEWATSREKFMRERVGGASGWQKTYYSGKLPDGRRGADDHLVKPRLKPFEEVKG